MLKGPQDERGMTVIAVPDEIFLLYDGHPAAYEGRTADPREAYEHWKRTDGSYVTRITATEEHRMRQAHWAKYGFSSEE